MTVTKFEIRPGSYYDSAVLMQLQKGLTELNGVLDAGAVMATAANCSLLEENNMLPLDEFKAGPEDLLIVIRADDDQSAGDALGSVDELLARRPAASLGEFKPRSMETALEIQPESNWVLVSVPGLYAAGVTEQALGFGQHVFLYSDNVTVEEEVRLKQLAQAEGRLVMGPDCGTAIINGIGFGFANIVRRGRIGIVGASGTGVQAVSVGVHTLGAGISQAIGTGGRDLHPEVGGITALQGLDLLARDPDTEVIIFISKPPDPTVAGKLLSSARRIGKPVVVNFIGYAPPARQRGNLFFAVNLSEAASLAVQLGSSSDFQLEEEPRTGDLPKRTGYLRGLFSGGTLAYEAMLGLQADLSPLYSNVPLIEGQLMKGKFDTQAHLIIDLGEDEYTAGRLHPMIDNDLRLRYFQEAVENSNIGLVLMDIVLGEGAHPDPAAEFAPVIERAIKRDGPEVVIVLVGTEEDSQNLSGQEERFLASGARVTRNLPEALAYVSDRLRVPTEIGPEVAIDLISSPVAAINIGLESFYASLKDQGAAAVHMDWKPPAGGNQKLMDLLNKVR